MNLARTIYLFVNGVATWPGDYTNWNKRAVTFTHLRTPHRAEAFEYFCTPLTRPFREDQREKHFARSLREYSKAGWKIVCVGHSNGAAVILKAMRDAHWPPVEALHLVCAACDADFNRNGLNFALHAGLIKKVCIYNGARDWAIRLANLSVGRLLGYGTLGMTGPLNMDVAVGDCVGGFWWKHYGHSDCWLPHNFNQTMSHFFNKREIT